MGPTNLARHPISRRAAIFAGLAASLCLLWGRPEARQAQPATRPQDTFAARVAALSEPGGYFNTDNLISNERSFLHVAPTLRTLGAKAPDAAYVGVGPDQNFSYIAQLRPAVAVIIDIRRDNLLLHLLFKALFAAANTRADYLALLTGRALPGNQDWAHASIDTVVRAIDTAQPLASARVATLRTDLARAVDRFGVPLTAADRATIDTFHRRFITDGLSLQFNTTGRAPQVDYPTYRDLILEKDLTGTRQSFLASEDDFQFVKRLQARDGVIPVVGDLSGPSAMASIGRFLSETHHPVSAFYTSNVEFYLFRDGTFPRFIANVGRLPHTPNAVIVRSVFPSGGGGAVLRPGYNSAQLTQPVQTLLDGYAKGLFRQYYELIR
ncbi:MAG TPA: hypothetical protein VFV78_09475 [Vicinamibacterales bacterium]|nr:hypothetical protein [Vicinamibacterales bacterium]